VLSEHAFQVFRSEQVFSDSGEIETMHIDNHHKGLLKEQISDLSLVREQIVDILLDVESAFKKHKVVEYEAVRRKDDRLNETARRLNDRQLPRIADDSSKTRLSILFYAIVEDVRALSKRHLRLLEIFNSKPLEATQA